MTVVDVGELEKDVIELHCRIGELEDQLKWANAAIVMRFIPKFCTFVPHTQQEITQEVLALSDLELEDIIKFAHKVMEHYDRRETKIRD